MEKPTGRVSGWLMVNEMTLEFGVSTGWDEMGGDECLGEEILLEHRSFHEYRKQGYWHRLT